MAAVNNVQSVRLMPIDEIVRRLNRMRGAPNLRRDNEITLGDIAKYMGLTRWTIQKHALGEDPVSDAWQIIYSRIFAQIDAGELRLQIVIDPMRKKGRGKLLVRAPRPTVPPKPEMRPRIDFFGMPKLKFD